MKAISYWTVAAVLVCASGAWAVDVEMVAVGNPGNAGKLSGESVVGGYGPDHVCGAVDYTYEIGKYEVTAGQYRDFLNAVAATDAYGLYNPAMDGASGCQITQNGTSGSHSYDFSGGTSEVPGSTAADWENRPVSHVSWADAARFANWLHNGQPTGVQDASTTENGAYDLSGTHAFYGPDGETLSGLRGAIMIVARQAGAIWVIPSEDEWYKAAYHKSDGATGDFYDYPTCGDSVPECECCSSDEVSANFDCNGDETDGRACGAPYLRSQVGCHVASASCYGTFDQGGNVWEWNEAEVDRIRGVRGGSFHRGVVKLHGGQRHNTGPESEDSSYGFRVAMVAAECGNGIKEYGEGCDDGDTENGDGCSSTCTIDEGWQCSGEPSVCFEPTVPALSAWGLFALALPVLTAGSLVMLRRSQCRAA